jgi:apolipoprotein N-acyltransferase
MKNILKKTYIYFILAGILLSLSWPMRGLPLLLFVAWVPFYFGLYFLGKQQKKAFSYFTHSILTFLVWNAATTWWIWNSTKVGALVAIVGNTFLMSVVVWIYGWVRRKLFQNDFKSFLLFPFFWVNFEFLHYRWELAWPWLTLGNGLATLPRWIQWYEFTGVLGGSLWILFINLAFFILLLSFVNKNFAWKTARQRNFFLLTFFFFFAVPLIYSYYRYYSYKEKVNPVRVRVVQHNVDPWKEEFTLTAEQILDRIFKQLSSDSTQNIDFIVCPESALQEGMYEDEFNYSFSIPAIVEKIKTSFPTAVCVTGASTYKEIPADQIGPATRVHGEGDYYYEAYNTALYVDSSGVKEIYHKIKLVPGVERMPYAWLFKPLEKLALDLGGTTGTLGSSSGPVIYTAGKVPVGTVICYESAFGEFFSSFVKSGAQLLFVITNDGWWGNTPGHRQHLLMSVLRAIETRRSIARAANTGISAAINQRGDILEQTKYWEPAGFTVTLNANDKQTIYTLYGDYLGRMSLVVVVLILLATISFSFAKYKSR